MSIFKAHVKNGHIVPDDKVDLPDGTEVMVVVLDALTPEERAQLDATLEKGFAQLDAGMGADVQAHLQELRAKR